MSGKSESNKPVMPEGFEHHKTQTGKQLVLYGVPEAKPARSTVPSLVIGLVWCILGGVWASTEVMLTCAFVGYGATISSWGRSTAWHLLPFTCAFAAALVGAILIDGNPLALPGATLSIALSCTIATLRCKGRLSGSILLGIALLGGLAIIGVDIAEKTLQGRTVSGELLSAVDEATKGLTGSVYTDAHEVIAITRQLIGGYWPTLYVVTAGLMTLCAHMGENAAARLRGELRLEWLKALDLPLAVAVAFAAGVPAQLFGANIPTWGDQVMFVGANVVMLTRIALALQGMGVVSWYLSHKGLGPVTRVLSMVVAAWLEVSFVVMCVVGLLDMATNLRRCDRRRKSLVSWPAKEG